MKDIRKELFEELKYLNVLWPLLVYNYQCNSPIGQQILPSASKLLFQVTEDDVVMEKQGAKVMVDKESLEYLGGATVDYHVELIRQRWKRESQENVLMIKNELFIKGLGL